MKRSALLYAVLLCIEGTLAQDNTIGYVVDDTEESISTITCYNSDQGVYQETLLESDNDLIFCADPEATSFAFGRTCSGDTLYYVAGTSYETTATSEAVECFDSCTWVNVIQQYPSEGITWTNYDCAEHLTTIFGTNIPEVMYYELLEDPFETLTESESSTEANRPTITPPALTVTVTATPSSTSTTSPDDDDEEIDPGDEEIRKGPDVPVIVGAVVGSVIGVALLVAAVCIGVRLERKRSASGESRGFTEALPRVSVVWPSSGDKHSAVDRPSPAMQPYSIQSSSPTSQPYPLQTPSPAMTGGAIKPEEQYHAGFTPVPNQHGWAGGDNTYRHEVGTDIQVHELAASVGTAHRHG